jgi:hypothetical protein
MRPSFRVDAELRGADRQTHQPVGPAAYVDGSKLFHELQFYDNSIVYKKIDGALSNCIRRTCLSVLPFDHKTAFSRAR